MKSFEKTVSVLISAFVNETLAHETFCGCAVGNILAEANGCKVKNNQYGFFNWYKGKKIVNTLWRFVFSTVDSVQITFEKHYNGEAKKEIDASGYTWRELAKIEFAFETAEGKTADERMFNGLVAVFSVLAEIHSVDLSVKEQALQALQAAK